MCDILGPELSRALFLYAWKTRGIKPRELGITSAYANMIARGKRRVSQSLLDKLLSVLTAKDLIQVLTTIDPGCRRSSAWLERRPGKAEVPGSNPGGGSTLRAFHHSYSRSNVWNNIWR